MDPKAFDADLIAALAAIIALAGTYLGWRRRELRREEVLKWGLDCIEVLQTSLMMVQLIRNTRQINSPAELRQLQVRSAILCEQGRLFFKNRNRSMSGRNKRPAYRGLRPIILDRLIINFEVLKLLSEGDISDVVHIADIAEDNLKHFVSLIQSEVGRSRTSSADASIGGEEIDLKRLIDAEKKAKEENENR